MITSEIKQQIKARDKRCMLCGDTNELTIDHIIPIAEGGSDHYNNLHTLCANCNRRKGALPPLWQQVKNLFNGNFYYFKHDIRWEVQGARLIFERFKKELEEKLQSKFANIAGLLKGQETTNKVIFGQLDGERKKSIILTEELQKLKEEEAGNQFVLWQRLRALESYHKLYWDEHKGYQKIKAKKTR